MAETQVKVVFITGTKKAKEKKQEKRVPQGSTEVLNSMSEVLVLLWHLYKLTFSQLTLMKVLLSLINFHVFPTAPEHNKRYNVLLQVRIHTVLVGLSRKIRHDCQLNILVFVHIFICYSQISEGSVTNNAFAKTKTFQEKKNSECCNLSVLSIFSFVSTSTTYIMKTTKKN